MLAVEGARTGQAVRGDRRRQWRRPPGSRSASVSASSAPTAPARRRRSRWSPASPADGGQAPRDRWRRRPRPARSRRGSESFRRERLDRDLTAEEPDRVWQLLLGAREASDAPPSCSIRCARRTAGAPIDALSGGMKRRLMIAARSSTPRSCSSSTSRPPGSDPQARRLVWDRPRTLKREGKTLLITTHYMEEAAQLCDRLIILDHGRDRPRDPAGAVRRAVAPR